MNVSATSSSSVFVANAIARALGHGMAMDDSELEGVSALDQLQNAWVAKAQEIWDMLPEDQKWSAPMFGWIVGWDDDVLTHTTGSGRLQIIAEPETVGIIFRKGPNSFEECTEGADVAVIRWDGGDNSWLVEWLDEDNLVGRPDRLGLVKRLDEEFGGEILRELRQSGRALDERFIDLLEAPHDGAPQYKLTRGMQSIQSGWQESLVRFLLSEPDIRPNLQEEVWGCRPSNWLGRPLAVIKTTEHIILLPFDSAPVWVKMEGGNPLHLERALRKGLAFAYPSDAGQPETAQATADAIDAFEARQARAEELKKEREERKVRRDERRASYIFL